MLKNNKGSWVMSIDDSEVLEESIIMLLIQTNINKDRAYLDTIKRILEGNDRSKVASKYKSFPFYSRFPNINRWTLKNQIDKMTKEKKVNAFEGTNRSLYYSINKSQLLKIEDDEYNKIIELLINQIIDS